MGSSFETSFIPQVVEKTPFADTPARNFFGAWCRINDSITPTFISREKWNQIVEQGILMENDQGKQTLLLPEDLRLWEMMYVIKAVDHDTLAKKPEKREERADKIKELGGTFEKAGIYLYKYLPTIENTEGKTIAENIAREFYRYGLSLQGKGRKQFQIPDTPELSPEDKAKLDEWFLGRDAYQKRFARLEKDPTGEKIEETRKRLLSVYFTALGKEGHKAEGEKPWETKVGPIQHLQYRIRRQIIKAVETPEREMKTAIFRRGVEKLVTEMTEVGWRKAINDFLGNFGFDPLLEQRRLYDTLQINTLKQELEEVRKFGDTKKISAKELEIAKKIQKKVSRFPYETDAYRPSEMVENQFINCLGSSILGGGLLDEVGIKYLHASLPEHVATVLITTDGKVYWQDFTPGNLEANYTEISSDMVEDKMDIPSMPDSGKSLRFKKWNPYPHVNGNLKVNLFHPEIGFQSNVLNNTGNALSELGSKEEAIVAYNQAISIDQTSTYPYNGLGNALRALGRTTEAIIVFQQAINIDPEYTALYNGLGNALSELHRNEEAIIVFQQAINIDPKYMAPYNGLGNALSKLGRNEEAISVFQQAINIDPKYETLYYGLGNVLSKLGRTEEAIVAFQQFIKLWNGEGAWIESARIIIEELQTKKGLYFSIRKGLD